MFKRNKASAPLTSRIEGSELVIEYVFKAPRELVFKAFSEAEHLKHWWGPKGWSLPVCHIDFRPGGVWHFCMKYTVKGTPYYGHESWGKAVFQEIVEPEKMVFIDSVSDAEGNVTTGAPETVVTLTFIEQENSTKVINRTKYTTPEALNKVVEMGVVQGVAQTYERLAHYLKTVKKL